MKVILAGYNVDSDVIEELKRYSPPREDVTPETLSAAYARISRDPRPANELRAAARAEVERARRSNQTIIFKMGHHSVAEHAVFNFDIINVSRLAIEEIEKFRLSSYTEKSQRYIRLGNDFVLPCEIRRAGKEDLFVETIRAQNALYHGLYERLKPYVFYKYSKLSENPKNHALLDGWAKEDARYAVSLSTEGQVGMTINGRNLELFLRRLGSKPLAELQELTLQMHGLAKTVAPSVLLFTEPSDWDLKTYSNLEEKIKGDGSLFYADPRLKDRAQKKKKNRPFFEPVRLVDATGEADDKVLASLIHTTSKLSFKDGLAKVKRLRPGEKKALFQTVFAHMEFYDFPPREFEYVDLTFDLIISASCFAQLKRHRMATMTCQRYDPGLDVTVPPSIQEIGAEKDFRELIQRTNATYEAIKKDVGPAADYILTNAHRRRVLLKVNARELYHVSRLREDATAQWDIREIVGQMSAVAREVMPLTCLVTGGKDAYPEIYEKVFGRKPIAVPPSLK